MKLVRVYIDESLKQSLKNLQQELAREIKKKYKLKEVFISDGFTSQVLAAKIDNKDFLDFKINKIGLNKGIVHLKS